VLFTTLVGCQRTWIVRNLDVDNLATRGIGHVGGNVGDCTFCPSQSLLSVSVAAFVDRKFQRYDFTAIGIEKGIILADADAVILETAGVGVTVGEGGIERRKKNRIVIRSRSRAYAVSCRP
jgi:hypothetical protein